MKRMAYIWLAGVVVAGMLAVPSGAQTDSLGDYARSIRKAKDDGKPPAANKKYDNDNLPKNDGLSVVGNAPDEDKSADNTAQKTEDSADAKDTDEKSKEKQKTEDEWKKKLDAQKDQIDLLARELDVTQREYRLRAATFYADAGDRLRNSAAWDKEDTVQATDCRQAEGAGRRSEAARRHEGRSSQSGRKILRPEITLRATPTGEPARTPATPLKGSPWRCGGRSRLRHPQPLNLTNVMAAMHPVELSPLLTC